MSSHIYEWTTGHIHLDTQVLCFHVTSMAAVSSTLKKIVKNLQVFLQDWSLKLRMKKQQTLVTNRKITNTETCVVNSGPITN